MPKSLALVTAMIAGAVSLMLTDPALAQSGARTDLRTELTFRRLARIGYINVIEPPNDRRSTTTPVDVTVTPGQLEARISPVLSEACGRSLFNQRERTRYGAPVIARRRLVKTLGLAHGNGFNLVDKRNFARDQRYYLFEYDGTSECRVYQFNDE